MDNTSIKLPRSLVALIVVLVGAVCVLRLFAAEPQSGSYEYATIRWAGRDNTHIVRPGGQVELIGSELRKMAKPDRADDRAFYMNLAMNGMVKEGYEFAGMSSDEIVMKRMIK